MVKPKASQLFHPIGGVGAICAAEVAAQESGKRNVASNIILNDWFSISSTSKQSCQPPGRRGDESRRRKSKDPRYHDIPRNTPTNRRDTLSRSHAHDRTSDSV